jgi:hypothetical protein
MSPLHRRRPRVLSEAVELEDYGCRQPTASGRGKKSFKSPNMTPIVQDTVLLLFFSRQGCRHEMRLRNHVNSAPPASAVTDRTAQTCDVLTVSCGGYIEWRLCSSARH